MPDTDTGIGRKPFQQSPSTGLLIAFLTQLAEAADFRVVAYAELCEVAHQPDIEKARHHVVRARLRVLRDRNKWFKTVPGVGLKLATDAEAAEVLREARTRIGRAARRGRERGGVADTDKLTNAQRLAYFADNALLCIFEKGSRSIAAKRLEAAIEKSGPKSFEAQELMRITGVKGTD